MLIEKSDVKSLWIITREYAGIAEAGGVKNVSCSLAEGLNNAGCDVTVFIPLYGCSDLSQIQKFSELSLFPVDIEVNKINYTIKYISGYMKNVRIVFIKNQLFESKKAVYVYTDEEQLKNPLYKRGQGHSDSFTMNSIFQQAVLQYGSLTGFIPEIIHCQDAATAVLPVIAKTKHPYDKYFSNTKFVVTIHNGGPGYHHSFQSLELAEQITGLSKKVLADGISKYSNNCVEPFLLASKYSIITTVSPWYAKELSDPNNEFTGNLSKEFYARKIYIQGITNGIDYSKYNPTKTEISLLSDTFDPMHNDFDGKVKIKEKFINDINNRNKEFSTLPCYGTIQDYNEDTCFFIYQGRVVSQKGINILTEVANKLLKSKENVKFIINGQGQAELENNQIESAKEFEGSYVFIRGYERKVARTCVASGDFLLLPSIFEPCCLEDFIAQIYGTIPIANAVGGLNKIIDNETGFLYENNTVENLYKKLLLVIDLWNKDKATIRNIQIQGAKNVKKQYSWSNVIQNNYIPLYNSLLK